MGVNGRMRAISVTNPASSWLTRKDSPEGADVDIEVGFRDVDTDEAGMFHDPSLHMRALSAQATVRVR